MPPSSLKGKRGRKKTTRGDSSSSSSSSNYNSSVSASVSPAISSRSKTPPGIELSAIFSDEPSSIQYLVGSSVYPELEEEKKTSFEIKFSQLLIDTKTLPVKTTLDTFDACIMNVVATAETQCTIDTRRFYSETSNATTFKNSVVYIATRMPSAKLALFRSGKILCSGTHSIEDAKYAIKKVVRMLRRVGFNAKFANFEVVTTVTHFDMKFAIDIKTLRDNCAGYCTVTKSKTLYSFIYLFIIH